MEIPTKSSASCPSAQHSLLIHALNGGLRQAEHIPWLQTFLAPKNAKDSFLEDWLLPGWCTNMLMKPKPFVAWAKVVMKNFWPNHLARDDVFLLAILPKCHFWHNKQSLMYSPFESSCTISKMLTWKTGYIRSLFICPYIRQIGCCPLMGKISLNPYM